MGKCFGYNFVGQLGLGDESDRGDEPGEMGADLPFVQFAITTAQPTREPTFAITTATPTTNNPTQSPSTFMPTVAPSVSANQTETRQPTDAPVVLPNQSKSAAKTFIFAVSVGVCFS